MLAMHDMISLLCITFLIFMTSECLVIALFNAMYETLLCEEVIKIICCHNTEYYDMRCFVLF